MEGEKPKRPEPGSPEMKAIGERMEKLRQRVLTLISQDPEFKDMMPSEQMAALNTVAGDVVYAISKATEPDNLEKMLLDGSVVWAKNMLLHMAMLVKKDEAAKPSPFAQAVAAFQSSLKKGA